MQLIFKLLHYFSQDDLEITFHGDGSDAKDKLQAEEAENTRKMEKKMFQKDGSMLWCCRDYSWESTHASHLEISDPPDQDQHSQTKVAGLSVRFRSL